MKRFPLFIGIAFPVVLVGILYLVSSNDPFGIFDETYLMGTGVALPAAVLTLAFIVMRRTGGRFWVPFVLLALWVVAVTLAHFWIVAQIAGGV